MKKERDILSIVNLWISKTTLFLHHSQLSVATSSRSTDIPSSSCTSDILASSCTSSSTSPPLLPLRLRLPPLDVFRWGCAGCSAGDEREVCRVYACGASVCVSSVRVGCCTRAVRLL